MVILIILVPHFFFFKVIASNVELLPEGLKLALSFPLSIARTEFPVLVFASELTCCGQSSASALSLMTYVNYFLPLFLLCLVWDETE